MNYIHIGLPKCASTFLQYEIFPAIAKILGVKFVNNSSLTKIELKKHYLRVYFNQKIKKVKLSRNSIISFEKLVGYEDPYYWENFSNKNLKAFGMNNHIIIIIREPEAFLSSLYLEECIQKNFFPDPKYFFLKKENYTTQSGMKKFSIEDFDYIKLIKFYKKKFRKVSVIKFEDLFDLKIFVKLFNLNDKQAYALSKAVSFKKKINTSYLTSTVMILKIINKILSFFDLSLQLKIFRYDDFEFLKKNNKKKKFLKRFIINLKKIISVRFVAFLILNKIPVGKKFYINFKKCNINLSKQKKIYRQIKTEIHT